MNRQTVFDAVPADTGGIVFAGDSHTQRFELTEFFHRTDIRNRGIDGDIAAGLLNRLNQIERLKPKKIFVLIGTNDVMKYNLPTDSVAKDVHLIITHLKTSCPFATIYLQSIFPCKGLKGIQVMNRKYKDICRKNNITFINLYPHFDNAGSLKKEYDCGDGIHLNGKGYRKWKEIIDPYVKYGFTVSEKEIAYTANQQLQ